MDGPITMAATSALCFALVSAVVYLLLGSAKQHGDEMKITQVSSSN